MVHLVKGVDKVEQKVMRRISIHSVFLEIQLWAFFPWFGIKSWLLDHWCNVMHNGKTSARGMYDKTTVYHVYTCLPVICFVSSNLYQHDCLTPVYIHYSVTDGGIQGLNTSHYEPCFGLLSGYAFSVGMEFVSFFSWVRFFGHLHTRPILKAVFYRFETAVSLCYCSAVINSTTVTINQ